MAIRHSKVHVPRVDLFGMYIFCTFAGVSLCACVLVRCTSSSTVRPNDSQDGKPPLKDAAEHLKLCRRFVSDV